MGALALLAAAFVSLSAAQEASTPTITLAAVGDIRLNGPVGELIRRSGMKAPSDGVRDLLKADIVFGNLETSVTDRGTKTAKTWNFRAPPANVKALNEAGFTIVNLANNHVWDYGREGFLDTLAAVKKHHLLYIGGGKDLAEAEKLRVIEAGGLRVGFIGYTSTFPQEGWAKKGKPGVNYADFDRMTAVVAAAKNDCDVLIVSFHGGTELSEQANQIQRDFSHLAITAGADLVLGHHPHVLQPVEVYKDKPIIYSLGNFLFVSPAPETAITVIARVALDAHGVSRIDFIPADTNGGQPKAADYEGTEAAFEALNRLGALTQYPQRFKVAGLSDEEAAAMKPEPWTQIRDAKDWRNPFLTIHPDGIELIAAGAPTEPVSLDDLESTLGDLPAEDWPYGKVVAVKQNPTESRGDPALVKTARPRVRAILLRMGIKADWWPAD
jgi:poly-gamma-glutamate synthesis protein (capsule biosynthesis protein)